MTRELDTSTSTYKGVCKEEGVGVEEVVQQQLKEGNCKQRARISFGNRKYSASNYYLTSILSIQQVKTVIRATFVAIQTADRLEKERNDERRFLPA